MIRSDKHGNYRRINALVGAKTKHGSVCFWPDMPRNLHEKYASAGTWNACSQNTVKTDIIKEYAQSFQLRISCMSITFNKNITFYREHESSNAM